MAVSLVLHGFICKIPVESANLKPELLQKKINISLLSLAAPSINQQKTEKKVEEVEVKKKAPVQKKVEKKVDNKIGEKLARKSQPKKKIIEIEVAKKEVTKKITKKANKKQIVQKTSNNKGSNKSTVKPILSNSDFVQTVAPIYPRSAVRRGIQGNVLVKVKIGQNGKPELVSVSKSSGNSSLDSSATKAVSKWDFKSSALAKSYNSWVLVPVEFVIR